MRKSTSFTPMQDLSAALVSLVASTAPSLVSVSSSRSRSSGFVWRPGLIVTADEALSEDGEFTIKLRNGDAVPAQLNPGTACQIEYRLIHLGRCW
jgi:hypothetical protein